MSIAAVCLASAVPPSVCRSAATLVHLKSGHLDVNYSTSKETCLRFEHSTTVRCYKCAEIYETRRCTVVTSGRAPASYMWSICGLIPSFYLSGVLTTNICRLSLSASVSAAYGPSALAFMAVGLRGRFSRKIKQRCYRENELISRSLREKSVSSINYRLGLRMTTGNIMKTIRPETFRLSVCVWGGGGV